MITDITGVVLIVVKNGDIKLRILEFKPEIIPKKSPAKQEIKNPIPPLSKVEATDCQNIVVPISL
jgi:hypothetical protein